MSDPVESQERTKLLAELATRQHGVVAARQLLEIGSTRRAIARARSSGRLHQVHQGVFAVGHKALTQNGQFMSAVLATGHGAVLSHRSASQLWKIGVVSIGRVEVTATSRGRRHHAGIRVHTTRNFRDQDHVVHEGIPVTSPSRTLFDLADVVSNRDLRSSFDAAARRRLIDLDALRDLRAISAGRIGRWKFAQVLADQTHEHEDTRSFLEVMFKFLSRNHGVERPLINHRILGHEVDAYWPDAALVIELDGYDVHAGREAFENDRIRDAALEAAGYRVMRFSYTRVRDRPAIVAAQVHSALALVTTRRHAT